MFWRILYFFLAWQFLNFLQFRLIHSSRISNLPLKILDHNFCNECEMWKTIRVRRNNKTHKAALTIERSSNHLKPYFIAVCLHSQDTNRGEGGLCQSPRRYHLTTYFKRSCNKIYFTFFTSPFHGIYKGYWIGYLLESFYYYVCSH